MSCASVYPRSLQKAGDTSTNFRFLFTTVTNSGSTLERERTLVSTAGRGSTRAERTCFVAAMRTCAKIYAPHERESTAPHFDLHSPASGENNPGELLPPFVASSAIWTRIDYLYPTAFFSFAKRNRIGLYLSMAVPPKPLRPRLRKPPRPIPSVVYKIGLLVVLVLLLYSVWKMYKRLPPAQPFHYPAYILLASKILG